MDDEGGDSPCWAERVCEACGVLVPPGAPHSCGEVTHLDQLDVGGSGGVIWAMGGERQLDVNVVALAPGGGIGAHQNREVDVLIVVIAGAGNLTLDGAVHSLAPHDLVTVPRGATREISAGSGGMRYLSIHRARPPIAIGASR